MIRRLKIKLITLTLTALLVLLAFIVTGINLLNYRTVVDDADKTLAVLSQNEGAFPEFEEGRPNWLPPGMSPEIPFESRFFSVVIGESGEFVHADTDRVYAMDSLTAEQYARQAMAQKSDRGFVENYRFICTAVSRGVRVTFLDCGRKLDLFHDFAVFSIGMSLLGYVATAVVVCFFAGKFIQPVAESYEKQKQFITNAGHEIKTPLTIIGANVDVLKMDLGYHESLCEIKTQTKRLTALTADLVSLAQMEESEKSLPMINFPVSEVVLDTALSFKILAQAQKKEIVLQVQPLLSLRGNEKAISQLVSILMENAIKYSPEDSRITLRMTRQKRKLMLFVANPSVAALNEETVRHVFDRFYRIDPSRNSETGGYGLGLSMARAIVIAHGGMIRAKAVDGHTFSICAVFPI